MSGRRRTFAGASILVVVVLTSLLMPSLSKDGAVPRVVEFHVTDIHTGLPVVGADISLLGNAGQPLNTQRTATDNRGIGTTLLFAGFGSGGGPIGTYDELVDSEVICTAAGYETRTQSVTGRHHRRTFLGLSWPIPKYRATIQLKRVPSTQP